MSLLGLRFSLPGLYAKNNLYVVSGSVCVSMCVWRRWGWSLESNKSPAATADQMEHPWNSLRQT